ncbi:MAG TPA: Na+/H+ antiporter subunit C [Euryarchaeota archaeon]|nr:Na+/H+ antiporter subunit C [Euryarchaeota archaeon]
MIAEFLWSIVIISIVGAILISLYGIARRPSLVKKLIALTILTDSANVLAIMIGYRLIYPIAPPVLPKLSEEGLAEFLATAVDPLPQALVITAVVIGMAVNILIAFAIIQIYRIYGTTDIRKIAKVIKK